MEQALASDMWGPHTLGWLTAIWLKNSMSSPTA